MEENKNMSNEKDNVPAENAEKHEYKEITIKFAKGCIEDTFTAKDGTEYSKIMIPNSDRADKSPWKSFVVKANHVHEDKFGKGMWIKLPQEGHTTISKPKLVGKLEDGRNRWEDERYQVSNLELKNMVEFYKDRNRESGTRETKDRSSVKDKIEENEESVRAQKSKAAETKSKKNKREVSL